MVNNVCTLVECSKQNADGISLHTIPKDELAAKRWNYFLEKANAKYSLWKPTKKMFICNLHFKHECIDYGVNGRRMIRPGAFPSILNGTDISALILYQFPNPKEQEELQTSSSIEVTPFHSPELEELRAERFKHELLIKAQMRRISELEGELNSAQQTIGKLRNELETLKRTSVKNLSKRCKRQTEKIQKMDTEIKTLKRCKLSTLPDPPSSADNLLLEIIKRRHLHSTHQYSEALKDFSFNAHYISPKGYSFLRESLGKLLPDPRNCSRWIKNIDVSPGILDVSLRDITRKCETGQIIYSLAFDEIAIRQQILFDGTKMIGKTDYGGISGDPADRMAKSSLFCLATEINGSKSFPIAYILTDGLKAKTMAEFVTTCITAVKNAGGSVLNISCDGLRANFSALQLLGANLDVSSENFNPVISNMDSEHFVMPDASHMMKLARNTLDKLKVIYNSDGQEIRWNYVSLLNEVQNREQLRAGNKITSQHVHFQQKKMNTKLSVQVLSNSTACGINFCRKIGIPGFEKCEATVEFFRVNDEVFDLCNSRPFGQDKNAPLSIMNKVRWSSIISAARNYYLKLSVLVGGAFIPLHQTKNGTFVKGLICCLSSLDLLMKKVETSAINLRYVPTYRMSQDPIELFFGTIRRRLGSNDNPNVSQLAYSVRAILSFKLSVCTTGNAMPLEFLQDKLEYTQVSAEEVGNCLSETGHKNENGMGNDLDVIDVSSLENLSLFVENVVVYIAGFVGNKLSNTLTCNDCILALRNNDREAMDLREDFLLIGEKNRGGLFQPSDDLIIICKITERIIRMEQVGGVLGLTSARIELLVKRECVGRNVFNNLHDSCSLSTFRKATLFHEASHKWFLVSQICKTYIKTRLHHIAKSITFNVKPVTNRSKFHKLVHFTGN